jgi:hypothetical protein
MVNFSAILSHFESNNLPYFTHPKYQKLITVVILHLPFTTPAEDISDGLLKFLFYVISIKQMQTARGSPAEGATTEKCTLFFITLPRTPKFNKIFKLTNLRHILVVIGVEAYKAQTCLKLTYLQEFLPCLG